jgi:transcriptional regulator with XRE-family HTH domain
MDHAGECRKRREQLGLTIEGLARLCGLKPELVGAYETGKHSASHSMRREIFLALQSLETIRTMLPDFRPEDPRQAAEKLDRFYRGDFAGHKRDPREWNLTNRELKLSGEAVD